MWPFPKGPGRLGLKSPIDAILAAGLRLSPPDTDVEPYYPEHLPEVGLDRYPSAFLSHTAADETAIRTSILAELTPYFGSVFFMNIGMARPTSTADIIQAYKRRILRALWASSWVVVHLSAAAASSPWVQFELAWALQHKPRNRIIALIPDSIVGRQLAPALRIIWQVPLLGLESWNRRAIRYALHMSGAKRAGRTVN
jgi:hypothetical protein